MRIRLVREAQEERKDAVRYYVSEDVPHAARRFLVALSQAYENIRTLPGKYRQRHDAYRAVDLKRFPYAIVYHVDANHDEIVVVAIAHHKRRPGYWQGRK